MNRVVEKRSLFIGATGALRGKLIPKHRHALRSLSHRT
jgi:hypothetical protein